MGSFVVACCAKVARFPRPGETLDASAFLTEPGGKGFNLAVAARRLGAEVGGVFAVGDDIFADFAERAFVSADLPTSALVRHDAATACGIGFTDLSGENCIAVFPGANAALTAADVATASRAISDADMVLAQFEAPDEPIEAAFRIARQEGRATILNPSPFRDLPSGLLALTSILVMNESEATELAARTVAGDGLDGSGGSRPDLAAVAADLMRSGPELVIVTLGRGGALAYPRDRAPVYQPAFSVEVRDTIGCGDAFTAGLATGLARGQSLPESLREAAACGAIVAGHHGVFDALPDAVKLETFLDGAIVA